MVFRTWTDWFIFKELSAESGRVDSSAIIEPSFVDFNSLLFAAMQPFQIKSNHTVYAHSKFTLFIRLCCKTAGTEGGKS